MAAFITINVQNKSSAAQDFYFFQTPPVYGGIGDASIWSNSLFSAPLAPYEGSGSVLTFQADVRPLAGAQQAHAAPEPGQASGFTSASQPIDLSDGTGTANDSTTMLTDPLGLTPAVNAPDVPEGAFRIITQSFNAQIDRYNVGLAVTTAAGGVVLSNFVTAIPDATVLVQLRLQFYVQMGSHAAGSVIDITEASATAALCDAMPGYNTFLVVYNANGTWTVTPFVTTSLDGALMDVVL